MHCVPGMTLRAAVAAIALAVAVGPTAAAADEPCQLNALDCVAVSRFSATADATSDALLLGALATPLVLELGRGLDDESARRGGAYAGAVGGTALAALVVKYAVRRDRPYTHNPRAAVIDYSAHAKGSDHSFFSGHTSLAFAALTTSAMLYEGDGNARLGLWAGAGALGAATGVLRVRAGQHFPSDVLVGAAVGTGFGLAVSRALAPEQRLRGDDLAAFGLGIVAGGTLAAVFPLPSDVPGEGTVVAPLVGAGLGGVAVAGSFR